MLQEAKKKMTDMTKYAVFFLTSRGFFFLFYFLESFYCFDFHTLTIDLYLSIRVRVRLFHIIWKMPRKLPFHASTTVGQK